MNDLLFVVKASLQRTAIVHISFPNSSLHFLPVSISRESAKKSSAAENSFRPLDKDLHADEKVFQSVFSKGMFPLSKRTAPGRLNTFRDFFVVCKTVFGLEAFLWLIRSRSGNNNSTSSLHFRKTSQSFADALGRLKTVFKSCSFIRKSSSNCRGRIR